MVRGYSRENGVDYTYSFAASWLATSFGLLWALVAGIRLRIDHYDAKSAFTQSNINYVRPFLGFEQYDKERNVLIVNWVLHGMHKGSISFAGIQTKRCLLKLGKCDSTTNPCLFIFNVSSGSRMNVGVYVDDIISVCGSQIFELLEPRII